MYTSHKRLFKMVDAYGDRGIGEKIFKSVVVYYYLYHMPNNDLNDFMQSATRQMEDDYNRIQKRALEDPGTAGDQGEENWAELLRMWLPHTFHVVTKGRILSEKGIASPQVDVIVLQPEYPKQLLNNKLYLAAGVLAAFECKVTLKAKHIKEFINNSIEVKRHLEEPKVNTYNEIQSPLLYGLLAHSHARLLSSRKGQVRSGFYL